MPRAVIAAPMLVDDVVIGTISTVSFRDDKRFTAADGDLTARLAAAAGVILDQRRHIDAIERAATDARARRGVTSAEDRVISAVGRLTKGSPESMDRVARLLEAIEAVMPPGAR